MIHSILVFLCVFINSNQAVVVPKEFKAKVIGVKDGDTIEVLFNNKPVVIRLDDIDTPEKNQPFGKKAKAFTSNFCFGKLVTVRSNKKDRYKRLIATVSLDGKVLNEELVKVGLAWHFTKYSAKVYYASLQRSAQVQKIGVWSTSNPVAPWVWRKTRHKKVA